MSVTTPITQRDVAEACGLHPSTVCLALKNSPSIPPETRRRIQAIAEGLGYQLNVAARNLALLRTEKKGAGHLPIAWINQEPRRDHWRADAAAKAYFEAARRRAEEMGYHLEEIWTEEPGMSPGRIAQIVRARGIEGVIFPVHRSFDFSLLNPGWGDFAMVGFNDHRLGEWVDVVCPDYYRNTDMALRRLAHLGFTRIGLTLTSQFDAATNGLAHSCFLRYQADVPPEDRVPVCFVSEAPHAGAEGFKEWLREHQPDVVIGCDPRFTTTKTGLSFEVPRVQLHGACDEFDAGVDPCAAETAVAAVDWVVEKVRRFEKGIRESTRVHLIKGLWQEKRLARREADIVVA